MPITPSIPIRRLGQQDFGELAYVVMRHVFAIHADFGRFFDEVIYKRELAARMPGVALEVAVDVTYGTFSKRYFADVLVQDGGLFEFKTAEGIHPRHRAQTIHYLRLFGLAHGKLVNLRAEEVEHEFVNSLRDRDELRQPAFLDAAWNSAAPGAASFRDIVTALVHDWGTGLDLALYEEAVEHFIASTQAVPVVGPSGPLANQPMRLVTPETAFKLTMLSESTDRFISHSRKLLRHTPLKAIHWANLTNDEVTFATIRP